ncbi:MAG: translocation/assembly module TamB domain-containing protein, partial [Longimicrobiales bacterium]
AVVEAAFNATAAGAFRELDLSGEGRIDALLMDETQIQGVEAGFQVHRTGEGGWTRGSAELRVDRFQNASFSLQSLDAEMDLVEEGTELSLNASAILDENREGRLSARVEDVQGSSAVRLEELEFRADEDEWKLMQPARISLSRGVEIDSLILEAGDQAVRVHGRIGSTGPLSLAVEMERFRLGTITDFLGVPGLLGQVSGSLALTGTAEAPNMEVQAQADLDPEDTDSSHVELSAGYADRSLDFEVRADMAEGRGFRADGAIPISFSLSDTARGLLDGEAMEVEARVDSLPLTWVGLFLSPETVRRLRGVAHGSFQLQGSPGDPYLVGDLALHQVAVGLPALGVGYRNGEARLRFREDLIHLDTLTVRSGDGSLNGSGTVTIASLKEPEYDLSIRIRDFRAMASSGVDAAVSGDLRISGTSLQPSVVGDVEVRRADIYLDDLTSSQGVETVPLSEEDYRELARVFGYRRPSSTPDTSPGLFQNASLELEVDLMRDSWIRQRTNPEMAVQFSGNLSVRKAPGDPLRLVGQVSAVSERSYVEQFGRRFSLTQGELVFQGAPMATRLDLRAEYEVPSRDNPQAPEVTIALDITGTPEDLRLDLSSSPPLEASDMVSYLAVGRPAGRSMGGGGGGLTETGGALALGSLSGAVEAYAREQVGLDVVEITTDGLDGVTLLAGRYVSPELYLGIRQPISLQRGSGESSERAADPEIELEFQAIRWLLLNLQAGGRSGVEFFVRSRISYE